MNFAKLPVALGLAAALTVISSGCATKKYVRQTVEPVQNQTNQVQKQTAENKQSIGELDRQVASADEKATDAGRKAGAAADAAAKANDAAGQAAQRADAARGFAEQGINGVNTRLDQTVQNLDNYQLVSTEKVLFRLGSAQLSKDAKAALDQAVQQMGSLRNFLIEIEGFADKTGSRAANLELSKRRADAVVRYLTLQHNVPLRRIHILGVGSEDPNANNKTRAARKENRRVDVKVYALNIGGGNLQSSTAPADNSQGSASRNLPRTTPTSTPQATPQP